MRARPVTLFDQVHRTDIRPAFHAESHYRYLNHTGRPPFGRVRVLLESWFDQYPEFNEGQWLNRFRSRDDRQHLGALFELYCRALLGGQGFEVDREPLLVPGKATRPEFLVLRGGRAVFVLEATVRVDQELIGTRQKRINQLYDTLDRLQSPNFFLDVRMGALGPSNPNTRALRAQLEEWLSALDPDEVTRTYLTGGLPGLPSFVWNQEDWRILFSPIPKKPEARARPGRPVGLTSGGGGWVTGDPLYRAVIGKATRYGRPDIPYVVAVNLIGTFIGPEEVHSALFGTAPWRTELGNETIGPSSSSSGCFYSGGRPVNTRLSAVLVVNDLFAHMIGKSPAALWHNPWANHPLRADLWQGHRMVPDVFMLTMRPKEGKTPAGILGLPADWPGWNDDKTRE